MNAFLRIALLVALVAALAFLFLSGRAGNAPTASIPEPEATAPAYQEVADAFDREQFLADQAALRFRSLLEQLGNRPDGTRSGEVILTFKDGDAYARFLKYAADKKLAILGRLDRLHAVRVGIGSGDDLLSALAGTGEPMEAVAWNPILENPAPTLDRRDEARTINAPVGADLLSLLGIASDNAPWGSGIKIAVLDSGVADLSAFNPGQLSRIDIGLGLAPDASGHGTAVAALAAGSGEGTSGIAPAAQLLSVKVTGPDGTADAFSMAQGVLAAAEAGADVINISMGGYQDSPVLQSAIDRANEMGAVVVASAGNDQATRLTWPAEGPNVLAVGAVDRNNDLVSYSNTGAALDLAAPGFAVPTIWADAGGTRQVLMSGTSASAPIVSGAVAAIMSQIPGTTAHQASTILQRNATEAGAIGRDPLFGSGVINIGWATHSNQPGYFDPSINSIGYAPGSRQGTVLVQNRSNGAIATSDLVIEVAGEPVTRVAIAPMQAAESRAYSFRASTASSQITVRATLTPPTGITDIAPQNNSARRIYSSE
jgi:hypothetical protein